MDDTLKPSDGFNYYAPETIFFNSFCQFALDWNRQISGSPDRDWRALLKERFGRFEKALFVSCGNGWVERACFAEGLIGEATGFDIIPELLDQARQEAKKVAMPSTYTLADGNKIDLPEGAFDLVVNHAACHHIAHIDRLIRGIHRSLRPNGLYVMVDYTGSHRNQYSWPVWERVVKVHEQLPARYRNDLIYPHMPTMLAVDPTEAVHSELIMEVTARYFDFDACVPIGGGIAHPVLAGCAKLLADQYTEEGKELISWLLREDRKLTEKDPSSNLFTFAICRPKATARMPSDTMLQAWSAEETERELAALRNGGRYYAPTALELIYHRYALEKMTFIHRIAALEAQVNQAQRHVAERADGS